MGVRRSYEEIASSRNSGKTHKIFVPAVHTYSGCRFSFVKKVDVDTYLELYPTILMQMENDDKVKRWEERYGLRTENCEV